MNLKHTDHYNNMLIYGNCECGAGVTIKTLISQLEVSKLKKTKDGRYTQKTLNYLAKESIPY